MSKKSTRRLVKNSHKRAIEDELWQGLDHADEVQQLVSLRVVDGAVALHDHAHTALELKIPPLFTSRFHFQQTTISWSKRESLSRCFCLVKLIVCHFIMEASF